ncbi:hypothetical protein PVK06_023924 [Gossypium arboreum]|uniref:Protein ABIL1-like n=1 Tax=Gossypium arboreum TaxID=29729 RepID=A0ABR0PCI3_GOSAR|nr:hypothetical protein PVK06_023924 [Gossypium arboreum]
MAFDQVSSNSFLKALQELNNLKPQLYSAAKYSEKSLLHSELKQMVLDNLKDYAVQALVNVADHLGTVAYKLTDLLDQQTLQVSTIELKVSCLNQQLLMCQTYMDSEGLRQQKSTALTPRYQKHYILPNSVIEKVHFSRHVQTNPSQNYFQAKWLLASDTPASKTLSWHLASETKSTLKGISQTLGSNGIFQPPSNASGNFQLLDNGDGRNTKSPAIAFPASNSFMSTLGITHRHRELEGSKPLRASRFRSYGNQKHEIAGAPVRRKKALATSFVKQKSKAKGWI